MSDQETVPITKFVPNREHDRKSYPATNQAHYCWQMYNEWAMCKRINGGSDNLCMLKRVNVIDSCPREYYEAWDNQMGESKFLGITASKANIPHAEHAHH